MQTGMPTASPTHFDNPSHSKRNHFLGQWKLELFVIMLAKPILNKPQLQLHSSPAPVVCSEQGLQPLIDC